MIKKIVLCADDYGQSFAISQAIIDLVNTQKLSAVSCMVNCSSSKESAAWLKPKQNAIDIGLHFNLTEGQPLSQQFINYYGPNFFSLSQLIKRVCLRKLNRDVIIAELHAQIDFFYAFYGMMPNFIDGHHHIHQFPFIRDEIINFCLRKNFPESFYLRWVNPAPYSRNLPTFAKQFIISLLGARAYKKQLSIHNLPHNTSFCGFYPFSGDYQKWFQTFLRNIDNGGIIMCHPGLLERVEKAGSINKESDVNGAARYLEYQYFQSEIYIKDCFSHSVKMTRFGDFLK